MFTWIHHHPLLVTWMTVISAAMFVAGIVLVPVIVARMPADHFLHRRPRADSWPGRHPLVRLALLVVRNLVGLVLLLAGIAMLVLPGQGILTMLVALSMIDLPGKRHLEIFIVSRKPVRRGIDWLRHRAGQPPLLLPGDVAVSSPDVAAAPDPREAARP